MRTLDLLWDIESYWNSLYACQKELMDLNRGSRAKAMEKEIVRIEKRLHSSKVKQEKSKERLMELDNKLKINNFNMEELERSLYDGNISDMKQLEYLNKEKEKVRETIDKAEMETLEIMDKVESIDQNMDGMEKELEGIRIDDSKAKANHDSLVQKLNGEISSIEEKIKIAEEEIDIKTLDEYNRIRESKGNGIVELRDSICMGCNIKIPTFSMEKIKNTKEIFRCESCWRILYHKE